jgi:hypothetical protein
MKKRKPLSEETKRKISLANTGKVRTTETKNKLRAIGLGKKHSDETKEKMRAARLGVKLSEEAKKKISTAHKGKKCKPASDETKKKIGDSMREDKSYKWKGDDVGYRGLHLWVEKHLGKPNKCSHCGKLSDEEREMQWANISGKYLRVITDWIRLCRKCHAVMDGRGKNFNKNN